MKNIKQFDGNINKHLQHKYTWDEWLIYLPPCHVGCCPFRGVPDGRDCRYCIRNLMQWIITAREKLEIHNMIANELEDKRGKKMVYNI